MAQVVPWIGIATLAALLLPLPWPNSWVGGHILSRIDVAVPAERVFAYLTEPRNWPRWHPASRAVRGITERTPRVGESVVETFEVARRRREVTWTTVELDPPRRWSFASTTRGGGAARIVYTLSGNDRGTLWERELTYRGPNLLFGILNLIQVRAMVESDSAQAVANVKRQLEVCL